MRAISRIASLLRNLFRRRERDADLDAEVRSYVELLADEKIRAGAAPAEASRQARIESGGVEQMAQQVRESRAGAWLGAFAQDVRFGLRMLRKSPGFTAVAVLTLALAIGANTAIFSLLDSVLLRPLPVRDPSHLYIFGALGKNYPRYNGMVTFGDCANTGAAWCPFSVPFLRAIQSHGDVFSGLAAFAGPMRTDMSGNGPARIAYTEFVSGNFFSTLGATTILGRPLLPSDDSTSAPPVIVLSYAYWRSAFASRRSAIGQTVFLNRQPFTIVGVASPRFSGLKLDQDDLWVSFGAATPLNILHGPHSDDRSNTAWIIIAGRLKPGISLSQAQTAASLIYRDHLFSQKLSDASDDPHIILMAASKVLDGGRAGFVPQLFALMFAVGLILLIACANLAGLMLARSAARRKETAVRLALGASRGRVIRQWLTEGVLLSVLGGIFGILFAYWSVHGLLAFMSVSSVGNQLSFDVNPDARVLAFTAGVAILTGILFGLGPAVRGTRLDLTPALKENSSSRPGGATRARRWFSSGSALVAVQVALAVVMLAGAGLLVRTLENFRRVNPGFDTRHTLLFTVDPSLAGYDEASVPPLYSNLRAELAAIPGVRFVSYTSMPLLSHYSSESGVRIGTSPSLPTMPIQTMQVGPDFFSGMHVPLLLGRDFRPADFVQTTRASQRVISEVTAPGFSPARAARQRPTPETLIPAIVNTAFVRKYLEPQKIAPLGKLLDLLPTHEIVGVVADMHSEDLRAPIDEPTLYSPLIDGEADFELRAAGNPAALIPAVREVVAHTDSNLAVSHLATFSQQINHLLAAQRMMAEVSGVFAVVALVLVCIGLYGLLSYETARRTREIGIRIALGAAPRDVLRLVVRQGILVAVIGAILGTGASFAVTRYLQSLLFGVKPNDPATLIGVAILLLAVALLACYVPARRAMRVDPLIALRQE